MYKKRLLACVGGGAISAAVCLAGRQLLFGNPEIRPENLAAAIANRLLLGFVIALSAWRIPYLAHGALLGLIVSLSVSLGYVPDNITGFVAYTGAGVAYGVFIEWLSTKAFAAPMSLTGTSEQQGPAQVATLRGSQVLERRPTR